MTDHSAAAPGPDTPRSAYTVLERRATAATVALLLALAGIAWAATVDNARDMSSMGQGLAHVGTAMPFGVSAELFMAMWTTMMVAMSDNRPDRPAASVGHPSPGVKECGLRPRSAPATWPSGASSVWCRWPC